MVSDELIRIAILWHEQWHEGLEEASRLYFGEKNIPGMLAVLEPLHAILERGPQTLKETSFFQVINIGKPVKCFVFLQPFHFAGLRQ
jgi:FKBP12-rapamycin complex-associated protein